MSRKYSRLSIAGFALIILSVIIGQFFIFNDADFFDDIRNSDAYKYASSREIDHIDIFMGPQQ